jgi:hypothetical protein
MVSSRNLCHAPLCGKHFEPIRVTREPIASQLIQLLYPPARIRPSILRRFPYGSYSLNIA